MYSPTERWSLRVSVSLMLLKAVDEELEELEELEAVDDPQAVNAEADSTAVNTRDTIFFFIDILLFYILSHLGFWCYFRSFAAIATPT